MVQRNAISANKGRADWLGRARWGVFFHYLAANHWQINEGFEPPDHEQWKRYVDQVDVKAVANLIAEAGAKYIFITVTQGTAHLCSPNETYRRLVGDKLYKGTDRDLIAELAEACEQYGVRLMVYCSSHAPSEDVAVVEKLGCTPPWDAGRMGGLRPGTYHNVTGADERLSGFQRNWEAVLREWSQRWGPRVHGWWIDGCYHAGKLYDFPDDDEPNYKSFAGALRAGNPDAIVAFNSGVHVPVRVNSKHEDYTAGEVATAFPIGSHREPLTAHVDGKQFHVFSFLGSDWRRGNPRFTDALASELTCHIVRHGGAMTWDVPVDLTCRIPDAFVSQLKAIGQAVGRI